MKKLVCVLLLSFAVSLQAQTVDLTKVRTQLQQLQADLDALKALVPSVPPTSTTPVVHVALGQSIQAAIDAAVPGTVIRVAPGVYPGHLVLKNIAGASAALPLLIRPDVDDAQLPAPGTRASAALVMIQPGATDASTIGTAKGAAYWTLLGIGGTASNPTSTIVALGDGSEMTLADQPHDIVLDRTAFDGGWAVKRGVALNGAALSLINSSVINVMKPGQDSQVVGGWNGPGPFTILNNLLDGGTETVLFGGADPLIANLIPSDIVIRGNTITKSLVPMFTTKGTVKNALELKSARRVLIEGNVIEQSWVDGQTGFLLAFTVRNQSGGAPWSTVSDVEVRYNVLRHGNQGITVLGLDDIAKVAGGPINVSVRMQNVNIHDNLLYDLAAAGYGTGSKFAMFVNNGPINLTFAHNTFVGPTSVGLALSTGASKTLAASLIVRDNVVPEGSYGITGDNTAIGAPSWTASVDAASVFDYNQMLKGTSGRKIVYPGAHTTVGALTFDADFVATPALMGSDGLPVGCDLAKIRAAIPALDLTK